MVQAAPQADAQGFSWLPVGRARGAAGLLSWEALAGLVIGGLLALGFAAHLLPDGLAGICWRLSCLGYALICLMRGVDRRQGAALFGLFAPFLAAVVIDTAVLHAIAGMADLARQLFIFGFAAIVFAGARDPVARRVGSWALFAASAAILADALVRTLPLVSSGWSYAAARALKGKSFQGGFNANEVCFAGLVALLAGYRDVLVSRWISLAMAALLGLCSVFLAARTPLLALVAALAGGWMIARAPIWGACGRRRWLGLCAATLVIGGFMAAFISQIDAIAHSAFAAQLAGRAALWQIAIGAWPQQPLFGFGPGSFQAVIRANLGKAHFSSVDEFTSLYQLEAGGFHNIWLSVLVERGAVGMSGLFASWCLLAGFVLRHGGGLPRAQRVLACTVLISLFLRGQVEMAGLFDDADGPISQIVMMAIGLTFPQVPAPPALPRRARDLAARTAAANSAST
jgi:hypothetical protein